jgi:competence protein ComEC
VRFVAAIPALGLLAGSAAGFLAPDIPRPPVVASLIALSGVAVWAWRWPRPSVFLMSVTAAFFAGGVALSAKGWHEAWRPPLRAAFEDLARIERGRSAAEGRQLPEDDEVFARIEGVLRADGAAGASGASLSVDVDRISMPPQPVGRPPPPVDGADRWQPTSGGVLVNVVGSLAADRLDMWRAGRRVRLPVTLRRASRYLDPGVPDGERALARRGTTLVGTAKSGALVDVVSDGGWIDERIASVRAFARRAIADGVGRWSSRSAAIVAAIVIGDRAGLDEDVQRRLQEAGTYHVIAISGGNIAILAGLMLGAFRVAGVLGRTAMLAAIVILILYARLVGGGASVDRATLMAVVYFAARAMDHRSDPRNALAFVAGCLVAVDPLSVVDPAFVLTFGATLAILTVAPSVPRDRVPRWTEPAVAMAAASAATEALLFPVGAFVFSRVTFAGLVLNFAAIPLMAVAQVAGMVVVPVAALSARLAAAAGWVAHIGAAGLVESAGFVRFAPAVAFRVAPPDPAACAAYYVALFLALRARRLWRQLSIGAAALAAFWILAEPWTLLAARGDGRLHATFIDVGQGDSAFVRFPGGSTLLVDAGGLSGSSFDIGDRVVAPVLRDAGVRRLDYLALSHGDPDHIGGAPSIVSEFHPREVWEGTPVPRFAPLTALRLQAQAAGVRWSNVRTGDHAVIDKVEVRALHPPPPDWERQKVRNDDSTVLEIRWWDVSLLLTGDIGKAVERTIDPLPATKLRVLKVPHHGSLTSSSEEFVRSLHPDVAIVSVGRANHFGHPAPAVLERYKAIGTEIFRTDQDGAVTVDTDGHFITVSGFTGRRVTLGGRQ